MTHFLENYWGYLLAAVVLGLIVRGVISHRRDKKWTTAWNAADSAGKKAMLDAMPPSRDWSDQWEKLLLRDEIDEALAVERDAEDCLRLKTTPERLDRARLAEEAASRGITVHHKDDVNDLAYKLEALDARETEAHKQSLRADLPAV